MKQKYLLLILILSLINGQSFAEGKDSKSNSPSPSAKNDVFANADVSIFNKCPYEIRSEDASKLIADVSRDLNQYKNDLKEKKENCSIDADNINKNAAELQNLIRALSAETFPEDRSMASLTIQNQPFQCSNNLTSLNQFLNAYIPEAIADTIKNVPSEKLGGELGKKIEEEIAKCVDSNKDVQDPKKTENIKSCAYAALYGSSSASISNGSPIAAQWLSDCRKISDLSSTKWINKINEDARNNETKQASLTAAINQIMTTSDDLANMVAGIDTGPCQNLKQLKNSVNSLTQNALTTVGAFLGPMGTLGASFLAPSVTAIINRIGSNQRKINQTEDMQKVFENLGETQHQKFACNLYRANQMNCEKLNRQSYSQYLKIEPCQPTNLQSNLVELTYLASSLEVQLYPEGRKKVDKKNNNSNESSQDQPSADLKLSDAKKADILFNRIFEQNLDMEDGSKKSIYDYLFAADGVQSKINEQFNDSASSQAKKSTLKASYQHLDQIKRNLDQFKSSYDESNSSITSQKQVDPSLMTTIVEDFHHSSYNDAIQSYLGTVMIKPSAGKPGNESVIKDIKNDMQTSIAMNGISLLEPAAVMSNDKGYDLDNTLQTFYGEFLGEKSFIKKDYQKHLKKNVEDENEKITSEAMKGEYKKNKTGFFQRHIYPRYRDCMMNYQFAVNSTKSGFELDENYKKSCGFLKGCDVPIEFDSNKQEDYRGLSKKDFKTCKIMSKFRVIENEMLNKFNEDQTVCGKKPEDLFGN
jgi:hypothetical protein